MSPSSDHKHVQTPLSGPSPWGQDRIRVGAGAGNKAERVISRARTVPDLQAQTTPYPRGFVPTKPHTDLAEDVEVRLLAGIQQDNNTLGYE